MKCEYETLADHAGPCNGPVENRHAKTAYCFDGVRNSAEDPNKDFLACDEHYEQYRAFWQEQWDEYYGIVREGIAGALLRQDRVIDNEGPSLQDQFEDFASRVKFT